MSLEKLINVQNDLYERLYKTKINFKKSPKDRLTSQYLQARLEIIEKLWTQFSRNHTEIVKEFKSDQLSSSSYVTKDIYNESEELYIDLKSEMKTALFKIDDGSSLPSSEAKVGDVSANVKLPRITIPTFAGKYTEWPTFRDLFLSVIDKNKGLDKVQKLHYLKSYLDGEAEQLLRQIPISEANYDRCWALLESRYNNKKYLSHCILRRLLSQRNLVNESASALKDLIDTTTDCLGALTNLGIDVESWDILIIHILTLKLDPESRKEWEFRVTSVNESDKLPTLDQFNEFITSRYRALEFIESKPSLKNANVNIIKPNYGKNQNVNKVLHATTSACCQYCNENHRIINCTHFAKQNVATRRKFVQDRNLCYNCLGNNHSVRFCKIRASCRMCKRKHHDLLHSADEQDVIGKSQDVGQSNERRSSEREVNNCGPHDQIDVVTCFSKGESNNQVLLATALVKAVSRNGSRYILRAFLDQGSQASFVTEATVQNLGLKKKSVKGTISGIGGGCNLVSNAVVEVKIQSRIDPSVEMVVKAYVLPSITSMLPARRTVLLDWIDVGDIQLADPRYNIPDKVDILLGADVYTRVLQDGIKRGPGGLTVAQCTTLGWVLSGTVNSERNIESNITVMHTYEVDDEILKRFWELEAEPNMNKNLKLTEEEMRCEEIFAATTARDVNGRYIVNLPFRDEDPSCKYGSSREIALKRFYALENKLDRNRNFKQQYTEVMNEYIELGHMKLLSAGERPNSHAVYLPHHAVLRYDKDTTKVRVVFDASCKGKNGKSLNDDLMVGPTLQQEIRHILLRWRMHPICLTSDVVKMYRQVRVADQHTQFQRILWRDDKDAEIEEYELLTVTFGTASAPFLAVRSMLQVAVDEGEQYPRAAEILKKDYYVDDLMTGCETVEEGLAIYDEMNALLSKAGFELQKWSSNCNELLNKIKAGKENEEARTGIKIKQDEILKTLGLTWNRSEDSFHYSVKLPPLLEPVTKRRIISDISRLFDPLGWAAPVVIVAKVNIQRLWMSGVGWDDEIPQNIYKEWNTYRQELVRLTELVVPRWLGISSSDKQVDLHGFCDASKTAYAAVVYIRVVDAHGGIHVKLITAKTKVAPIKTVSIPRLELCGAVLLGKLIKEVATVMEIPKPNIHAWTDSEIVLAWLNSHPCRWKTFIANRVSEILSVTEPQQWYHVSSKQNPADFASRGMRPAELLEATMWLNGPEFLNEANIKLIKPKIKDTSLGQIKVHNIIKSDDDFIWNKYSSLSKLVRVVAFCRRALLWKKPKSERTIGHYLTADELKLALETCIRECQHQNFEDEILNLKSKTIISKKCALNTLTPFLDTANILRVGGRLGQSNLDLDHKHPIILPHKSNLTDLIVADAHCKTLHGGPQLMLNYLATKYYIFGAKALVKAFVRKCVTCLRYSASKQHQLMGQLPSVRVTPSKPFRKAGVDYAGPISLRTSKGRGHHAYKGYICLFICMATRAIHLEVVSDLTTQGFLAAFKRFVARRGHCSEIWSDNGTNFQGASKELKVLFHAEKGQIAREVAESLANNGTSWHYIPPHSPNFGGLWEAGIKSCKQHLKRIIGSSTLTYEEMATLLSQIEACLNSRPMYRLTDVNQIDALSPGHFLVGEPLINAPDHNFERTTTTLKRWQLVQRMTQQFWRRWSSEYLATLLQRHKWSRQMVEPNKGDIVLVMEDDLPPAKWLLGRIVTKHPGLDGLTRVVTLQTKASTIKRPISKLCVLPVS